MTRRTVVLFGLIFAITISYNFNNYKPERERDERQEEFEDEEVF